MCHAPACIKPSGYSAVASPRGNTGCRQHRRAAGLPPPEMAVGGLADYPEVHGGRLAVPVPPELLVVAPRLTQ
eukprot:CAMPEP_0172636896 /NCGR_PEP_ID=MMETSP1068-20121228/206153_1 /TAXON_ID=35684 /ORGANISM="Pseudopedinella elastica, Strain CCMP716" /LENGTH=72 /DNA_ID=CAMNT_0013449421 /DNA_START=171 /DNA_END=389 /DNA_ORIENTATION=+